MKKAAATVSSIVYLLSTRLAGAEETINLGEAQKQGVPAGTALNTIIKNTITIIFTVAALLVLAFLIFGAIQWITSGGDKEKVKTARGTIVHALIGLVVLALAFFIVRVVGQIVGFDILSGLALPKLSS